MRAAGGERAAWAYEWLPTGCPAVLVQLLAAAVLRPQVRMNARIKHTQATVHAQNLRPSLSHIKYDMSASLCMLQGNFAAALLHVSKGAELVDAILRDQGIDPKVCIGILPIGAFYVWS